MAVAVLLLALAGWVGKNQYRQWRLAHFRPMAGKYADFYGLDPALVMAVVAAESGGDVTAQSGADARGLMQITPITLAEVKDRRRLVGEGDLYDPEYNLKVGCAYLAQLWQRFDGDPAAVMAAYHMGPTKVAQWLAKHPGADGAALLASSATGPKTRAYVTQVLAEWESRRAAGSE